MHRDISWTDGFTLLELLIVIAMIGIVCAFAVPEFTQWRRNVQFKQAAEGLLAAARTAKNNAVTLNLQNRLECNPGGNRYRITEGNRAYSSTTWTTVKQDWITAPDGVVLRTGNCNNTDTSDVNVFFSPNGTGSAGTMCVNDDTGAKYKVIVGASGRIRLTKP
jgi:type II secretion system protein H